MFRTTGQALWPWQLFESGCSWGWPTKMQLVKYEWEKVQHAFLVTQYQVHGHASFAVMHANRSACTDKLTGELQLCLYIYIYRAIGILWIFAAIWILQQHETGATAVTEDVGGHWNYICTILEGVHRILNCKRNEQNCVYICVGSTKGWIIGETFWLIAIYDRKVVHDQDG